MNKARKNVKRNALQQPIESLCESHLPRKLGFGKWLFNDNKYAMTYCFIANKEW